jgi:hypothetical protein
MPFIPRPKSLGFSGMAYKESGRRVHGRLSEKAEGTV